MTSLPTLRTNTIETRKTCISKLYISVNCVYLSYDKLLDRADSSNNLLSVHYFIFSKPLLIRLTNWFFYVESYFFKSADINYSSECRVELRGLRGNYKHSSCDVIANGPLNDSTAFCTSDLLINRCNKSQFHTSSL